MKFRHYKGDLYTLITVAKHSETGEELVIYAGCGEGATGIWARPAKMFHERLSDGHLRFMQIKSFTDDEILEIAVSYGALEPQQILDIVRGAENAEERIREMYNMRQHYLYSCLFQEAQNYESRD